MKQIYTMVLCAAICTSSVVAAPNRFSKKRDAIKNAPARVINAKEATKLWRPVSAAEYIYDEGEWINVGESRFTYDERGNALQVVLDEDGYISLETNVYNDDNMLISTLTTVCEEGEDPQNESKKTYVYDSIIKNYVIERRGFSWTGESWQSNYYDENNIITRNAAGNILSIEKQLPLGGAMLPAYKSEWKYNDATGRAVEYTYYYNENFNEPEWQVYEDIVYKNIIWENTDGQMTKDFSELVEGANRVSSADVYYMDELDGHFFATYSGEKDYVIKNTFLNPDEVGEEIRRETIDDNGSYTMSHFLYVDEDDQLTEEPFSSEIFTTTLDEHGNIIEEVMTSTYADEPPMIAGQKYDYVYDDNGNPEEMTISYYDEELEEYVPESRTVYGNYIDVAGIESAVVDNDIKISLIGRTLTVSSGEVKVYSMQGIVLASGTAQLDLSALPSGVYIAATAGRSVRIVLR